MIKTRILYSTVDGHTKRICNRMADALRQAGEEVEVSCLDTISEAELAASDKILVGASIRYGKHRPALFEFGKRYQTLLEGKTNAFFTVNVVARKPLKNTPDTNPYMQKFLTLSAWQPQQLGVFAGKIDYPKYRLFDRTMIRFIMWMTKGPTDITGTFEFTDWDRVDAFAAEFAAR
nr:menaquinone-dependent protoporphyrinogen IX dehydrogenase [Shewanella submarina]